MMTNVLRRALAAVGATLCLAVAPSAQGDYAYYDVALSELDFGESGVPTRGGRNSSSWHWFSNPALWRRVVVAGDAEGYFHSGTGSEAHVALRAPVGEAVRGAVWLTNSAGTQLERHAFTLAPGGERAEAEAVFVEAGREYYRRLADSGVPGAAWFRHRALSIGDRPSDANLDRRRWRARPSAGELEQSYALFTGGRALAENLQLDRVLPAGDSTEATVDIESLSGITVQEIDWSEHLVGDEPPHDPLARHVPADQHAVFFPSFDAMVKLVDETAAYGTPVLAAFEARSSDAGTVERLQRQLCLPLDGVARVLGGRLVDSVAVTGSDPYLRTGSDVAILLESDEIAPLRAFVEARQQVALSTARGMSVVGVSAGLTYRGALTEDRSIASYTAEVEGALVVTNSLVQLRRIVDTIAARREALADAPDYRFFRRRYPLGATEETALAIVPDAAIRRWCGPHWRIATSRRTRAAAELAELQAAWIDAGRPEDTRAYAENLGLDRAEMRWSAVGPFSTVYGSLDFLTPVAELELPRVSEEEADLYRRWRDGYENNWSNFFDPIGVRFTVSDDTLAIDLSVFPIILGSDYRDMADVVGEATLAAGAGDAHEEAVAHFAMALDPDSEPLRELGELFSGMFSRVGASPLSWIGGDLALYADDSEFLQELAQSEDLEELVESLEVDLDQLPIVLHVGVSSGLKLALFLTAIRALADDTVPGMLNWETREVAEGQPYVRVSSSGLLDEDMALLYAATPDSLLLGFNEEALGRAVGRAHARTSGEAPSSEAAAPWLGASAAIGVRREALAFLEVLFDEPLVEWMQLGSWSNLPILNEWQRLFPERDPAQVHAELWGEELRCPGGGDYVWNAEAGTVESSVYGHPAEPRSGPALPAPLSAVERLRAGITFELEGLRARVELRR